MPSRRGAFRGRGLLGGWVPFVWVLVVIRVPVTDGDQDVSLVAVPMVVADMREVGGPGEIVVETPSRRPRAHTAPAPARPSAAVTAAVTPCVSRTHGSRRGRRAQTKSPFCSERERSE